MTAASPGLFAALSAQTETGPYDERGRCEICSGHRSDHGVGEVCPQERGASDLRGYLLNPAWA